MPDVDLMKQEEQGARDGKGRFRKGRSGNLAGRPAGIPNPAARAAMMLLDGEAEALTRKAVELALGGDAAALRLCFERIAGPRRGRPVAFELGAIDSAADLAAAMASVAAAAACGTITPDEALTLSRVVETFLRTLDARQAERHRDWLKAYYAGAQKSA
jgi:hypothetical protein